MSNIEEDIKILEKFNPGDEYTEKIKNAIENILSERKQDKARIQKLEEENKKYIVQLTDEQYRNLVDTIRKKVKQEFKQKVKDKIERHKNAKEVFEKEYDSKHYEDDGIRARDFYGIVTQDRIIQVLEELLEESK